MTYAEKQAKYRAGQYLFDPALVPGSAHHVWDENAWIVFIDNTGKWV